MYSAPITEEDSFLPAILWSNPAKQLEHVRGYYERQRERNLVLDRSLEDIRMSYSMKLCNERNRLSKSLWELEVRKRRLLHQIMEPHAKRTSDWRRKSISEAKKQRLKQKEKEEESKLDMPGRNTKRTSTKRKESKLEKATQQKPKTDADDTAETEQLEIPKHLLR